MCEQVLTYFEHACKLGEKFTRRNVSHDGSFKCNLLDERGYSYRTSWSKYHGGCYVNARITLTAIEVVDEVEKR